MQLLSVHGSAPFPLQHSFVLIQNICFIIILPSPQHSLHLTTTAQDMVRLGPVLHVAAFGGACVLLWDIDEIFMHLSIQSSQKGGSHMVSLPSSLCV